MYFHPWLPTVTPSQPISLPRPAPTCARTFGASENTASTWKNCRPRSVRSLCPSIFPCDNILHVSSGYPLFIEELTKAVLEDTRHLDSQAASVKVPATLQSSLIARF